MKNCIRLLRVLLFGPVLLILTDCTTLPEKMLSTGEDLSFVVVGDIQQGFGVFSELAYQIGDLEPIPCVAIFTGDYMTKPGNELEWIHFWNCAAPVTATMPVLLTRGNHEGNSAEDEYAFRTYGRITQEHFYYSFKQGNLLFVILDTHVKGEERSISGAQLEWLRDQLEEAEADSITDYIFLFMHRPLFPQANQRLLPLVNAEELHRLFADYPKVKAVFAGHEHLFSKNLRDSLDYIISGGGGAYLIRGYGGDYFHFIKVSVYLEEKRVNLKTIGLFHEVVEDFDL
ncbi:MAG: metallophosphoesterase [bacterium]